MSNSLQHYGVKGMRWGVRRFRNKDGTLTSAGKKRAERNSRTEEELKSEVKRLNLEKQRAKLEKDALEFTPTGKAKKIVDETSDLVKNIQKFNNDIHKGDSKKEPLNLKNMTDQQLRDRINRANLERQYSDLFAKKAEVSKGRMYATNVLEVGGGVLAISSSALSIALTIKQLKNKTG